MSKLRKPSKDMFVLRGTCPCAIEYATHFENCDAAQAECARLNKLVQDAEKLEKENTRLRAGIEETSRTIAVCGLINIANGAESAYIVQALKTMDKLRSVEE